MKAGPVCAALAAIAGSSAHAQAPGAPAAGSGCELHVWPGDDFRASNQSWLVAFGLVGTLADAVAQSGGDGAERAQLGDALDSAGQAQALGAVDLAALLGLPTHVVVRHDAPIATENARARNRHAASTSACYAELIVTRIAFQRSAFSGSSLRVTLLFRDFGGAAAPAWTREGRPGNMLGVWPPQHPNEARLAEAELVEVFRQDVAEFARDVAEARRRASTGSAPGR